MHQSVYISYLGQKVAKVINARKDTCSREVLRHEVQYVSTLVQYISTLVQYEIFIWLLFRKGKPSYHQENVWKLRQACVRNKHM